MTVSAAAASDADRLNAVDKAWLNSAATEPVTEEEVTVGFTVVEELLVEVVTGDGASFLFFSPSAVKTDGNNAAKLWFAFSLSKEVWPCRMVLYK